MSWFPIKKEDWNREAFNLGSNEKDTEKKTTKKKGKGMRIRNRTAAAAPTAAPTATPLPLTKQQGDEYEFKRLGQIKPHSIDKIKKEHKQNRQAEAALLISKINELLAQKLPKNYDLSKKRDQNRAIKIVANAKLFQSDLEVLPFLKAFIFPSSFTKRAEY